MGRAKRIWYLSPMRAAKVQASLRIRAVSPEPSLLAHTSSESRGTFRQKARSLASLNGWACAVKICHDGMLEDTNSLDGAHIRIMIFLQQPSLHVFVITILTLTIFAINGGNPLEPLCSQIEGFPRYPCILALVPPLYLEISLHDRWYALDPRTSDGITLVPRNAHACFGIVNHILQLWPVFAGPVLKTGRGSDSRRSHLTTNT